VLDDVLAPRFGEGDVDRGEAVGHTELTDHAGLVARAR
jgi:hypothetical protein